METIKSILNFVYGLRKHIYSILGILSLFIIFKLFSFSINKSNQDEAYQEYFNSHYKILGLNLPKDLNFSGEPVPINDFSVREALDREFLINTYWQSQTLLVHKRANRWFPVIEPILKRYGIPDDFKYIAVTESGLTNIVSPAKATGYWQIIESTAKNYGLEINEEIDERYSVEKSTEAACKYFKEAYSNFKNWTLVAASYNMGIGGIQSQLNSQKVTSYYDLLLNEETARYIYRILALKEIISRPKNYGFFLRKKDFYPPIPTNRITIDSGITDLTDFAIKEGYNYKILKLFNPWLRRSNLNNPDKKRYTLIFPKKEFLNYDFGSDVLYSENTSSSPVLDSVKFYTMDAVETDSTNRKGIHTLKEGEISMPTNPDKPLNNNE